MELAHFYHCWCGGLAAPYEEHVRALVESGFDAPVTIGLVGTSEQREPVRELFSANVPQVTFVEADQGWEEFTLRAARTYASEHTGAILYMHTHGAWHPSPLHDARRRYATDVFVRGWRERLQQLQSARADAILTVGVAGDWFNMARCSQWRSSEPLGLNSPAFFSSQCMWGGDLSHRAAADVFLLRSLARAADALFSLERHQESVGWGVGGRRRAITVADLSEHVLVAAVEDTRAGWPGWNLSGQDGEPAHVRLDQHFAAPRARFDDWRGAGPYTAFESIIPIDDEFRL